MTRPTVGSATNRAYEELPEFYRDADEALDYPLLRYLSLILDQLDPLEALLDRLDYEPADTPDRVVDVGRLSRLATGDVYGGDVYGGDTYGGADSSALTDPYLADGRWLPWLAQLAGINRPDATASDLRQLLTDPSTSWQHGTPAALTAAARAHLTGTQHVELINHYGGAPFTIGIRTIREEATTASTFGALKSIAPTWGRLKALGSYAAASGPAVVAGAERERPAGWRLIPIYTDELVP